MISPRCAYPIALAALAACAGGSTMRVAGDDESDPDPVALAPSPESSATDTSAAPAPEPSAAPVTPSEPAPPQGYAPYQSAAGTLELRRLGQWTRSGIGESRRLVVRDATAWAEFWSELAVGERPAVDFSRDLVVAVAAGQRPTGGHEIAVGQVAQNGGALTISVVETTPGPNCISTSSLTQPVDVVVIPNVNVKSWSFVERREVRDCR